MNPQELNSDPFKEFLKWYEMAEQAKLKNPNAMTLATANKKGVPSARVVLYKGTNQKGFLFYTNYKSQKAVELEENPHAALVFYWPSLDRQIRIQGKIEKISRAESDQYWETRPRESQIGALASQQSSKILGRKELEEEIKKLAHQFEDKKIPRPLHWGGFCLVPDHFEFWIEGKYRIHDRFCYTRKRNEWEFYQVAP
jgi:pyridoxamine 5'-phosphate oxidase